MQILNVVVLSQMHIIIMLAYCVHNNPPHHVSLSRWDRVYYPKYCKPIWWQFVHRQAGFRSQRSKRTDQNQSCDRICHRDLWWGDSKSHNMKNIHSYLSHDGPYYIYYFIVNVSRLRVNKHHLCMCVANSLYYWTKLFTLCDTNNLHNYTKPSIPHHQPLKRQNVATY